jgi:hypothetical protein
MHLKLIPKQHYMVHYPQWIRRSVSNERVHSMWKHTYCMVSVVSTIH